MSPDMRLLLFYEETGGSDGSEYMAVGLSDILCLNVTTGQAKTATYVDPPSGGPCCRLQDAAYSPVMSMNSRAEAGTLR